MRVRLGGSLVLIAVFGGCSDPYGEDVAPAATTSADATQAQAPDGGVSPGDKVQSKPPSSGKADAGACPSTRTIESASLPWKPPASAVGSCVLSDLLGLTAYVDAHADTTLALLETEGVPNATCRACIFGSDATASWAPIVVNAVGGIGALNLGGCIAIATGSTACGEAYQNWYDCQNVACDACAEGSGADACHTASTADGGACKGVLDHLRDTCGATVNDAATRCGGSRYAFEGPVKAQCIGGI